MSGTASNIQKLHRRMKNFRSCILDLECGLLLADDNSNSQACHNVSVPSGLDWREKGFVTRVRTQNVSFRDSSSYNR